MKRKFDGVNILGYFEDILSLREEYDIFLESLNVARLAIAF